MAGRRPTDRTRYLVSGEGESAESTAVLWYEPIEPEVRFYAWAGLIQQGRVVSMDFAPDVAWLKPGTQPALTFAGPIWWNEMELTRGNTSFVLIQTISVAPEGHLRINAACHAGTATVAIGPQALRVSDLTLEETDCRPHGPATPERLHEAEEDLLTILSADTIAYSIEAGVLELRAGSREFSFTAKFQGPPR